VGIRGNTNSKLCVAGEAPGADEDACGLPFMGYSGKEQDKMLFEAGVGANNAWFTNPYKTRPPDNKLPRLSEYGIPLSSFEEQFFAELEEYKPAIIIATGKTPTNLLCPETIPRKKGRKGEVDEEKEGFGKWRGSLLTSPKLAWPHYVIPIYHPAFVLRNWSERQISVLIYGRAWEEILYFHSKGTLQRLPERTLRHSPSYDEVVQYLLECLKQKERLSVDIELLFNRKLKVRFPYIFGIAKNPWDALAFTIWDFVGERLNRILRLINLILKTKWLIGQNFTTFDAHWLRSIGMRPRIELVSDTLIRHHTLYPELEHTLAFMCLQYTREPFYKDQGKAWPAGTSGAIVRKYCCRDCCVTYEVHDYQDVEFAECN
jgi:DNA polymerase